MADNTDTVCASCGRLLRRVAGYSTEHQWAIYFGSKNKDCAWTCPGCASVFHAWRLLNGGFDDHEEPMPSRIYYVI